MFILKISIGYLEFSKCAFALIASICTIILTNMNSLHRFLCVWFNSIGFTKSWTKMYTKNWNEIYSLYKSLQWVGQDFNFTDSNGCISFDVIQYLCLKNWKKNTFVLFCRNEWGTAWRACYCCQKKCWNERAETFTKAMRYDISRSNG